jgi:hypothetical protein
MALGLAVLTIKFLTERAGIDPTRRR